jgi:predicted GNAT family N-acyltransferase
MSRPNPTIEAAAWAEHGREIQAVRHAVFTLEQSVPANLDFDGADPDSCHALALSDDVPVATGRIQADGHIGRVAVLKEWRGRGIGTALVEFLSKEANHQGLDRVCLNSQMSAVAFYEKLSFQREGDTFMEAGIEHIRMVRDT